MTRALTVLLVLALAGPAGGQTFKIALATSGVYRIGYEDLAAAGLGEPPDARGLAMSAGGREVPLWVEDGGDGAFGPGDWLEFVGRRLAGEDGFHSEYATHNVYWLTTGASDPPRMTAAPGLGVESCGAAEPAITARRHWEENRLRVRFSSQQTRREDPWFWARMTHLDADPFTLPLELEELDADAPLPVTLRVRLRGWSSLPREQAAEPDHRVELSLDDRVVAASEWDNRPQGESLEIRLPASAVAADGALALRVPPRRLAGPGDPPVDVVLVDWVEIEYPRTSHLTASQSSVRLEDEGAPCAAFSAEGAGGLVLYGEDGRRRAAVEAPLPGAGRRHLVAEPGAGPVHLVLGGALRSPDSIVQDAPSDLRSAGRQADYLVIAHPRLLAAVEPLAELHRSRGLAVATASVEDVFDEFNHGVTHPRAIKDFIRYASSSWQAPGPRFVLLVGDASWDPFRAAPDDSSYADWTYSAVPGVDFSKNLSSPYAGGAGSAGRNLLPTWSHGTFQGYAASDNWFVTLDGDDLPDLAIGRLPVTTPEEVRAIVEKTVRYVADSAAGDWRSRVLLITNEAASQQRHSDRLAANLEREGFAPTKIYPLTSGETNRRETERLLAAFEEGYSLVHFSGHGGRYIWRTGATDYRKNRDLFTLDDLDELAPGHPLPIVLSMTCYSAPFDHPSADSIGEKLLRLADRGAAAVIAASWRNGASLQMSEALIAEVTRPGTLGEALLRAKRRAPLSDFVHLYNLLGDPALPTAAGVPDRPAASSASRAAAGGRADPLAE